ncbi:hypothetical protein PQ676_07105 [Rickettsia felis]|nr:hypothetical protein [Rickettsia felis]MDE8611959.1 hypothetical protein [Rickettsia felis]
MYTAIKKFTSKKERKKQITINNDVAEKHIPYFIIKYTQRNILNT